MATNRNEPALATIRHLHALVELRDREIAALRHQLETSDTRERVLMAARDVALRLAATSSPYPARRAPADAIDVLRGPVAEVVDGEAHEDDEY
jgi:hypothetical protein